MLHIRVCIFIKQNWLRSKIKNMGCLNTTGQCIGIKETNFFYLVIWCVKITTSMKVIVLSSLIHTTPIQPTWSIFQTIPFLSDFVRFMALKNLSIYDAETAVICYLYVLF